MIIDCGEYRIIPYPGNTCWCIQKRAGANAKKQWNNPRVYPSTLELAVKQVYEIKLRELDEELSVDEALAKAESIAEDLKASVAKAIEECGGDILAQKHRLDRD